MLTNQYVATGVLVGLGHIGPVAASSVTLECVAALSTAIESIAMKTSTSKRVTVLVYAAGNNELEPEVWSSVASGLGALTDSSVTAVVMVSRWPRSLVSLMRPTSRLIPDPEPWTGTRRYLFAGGSARVISESSAVCMANPLVLGDFIRFGVRKHPADVYVLVLSGHACRHVGFLTDYGPSGPHIMGIDSLSSAIRDACHETRVSLDALVMDVCYCNYLETIYEIAAECPLWQTTPAVHSIITHVNEGPLSGIPIDLIIRAAAESVEHYPIHEAFAAALTSGYDGDLVAIKTSQWSLLSARECLRRLVAEYEDSRLQRRSPHLAAEIGGSQSFIELKSIVGQMLIPAGPSATQLHPDAVSIATEVPSSTYYSKRYSILRLVYETGWGKLLGCPVKLAALKKPSSTPLPLPRSVLLANVMCMNPRVSESDSDSMVSRLADTLGWTLDADR